MIAWLRTRFWPTDKAEAPPPPPIDEDASAEHTNGHLRSEHVVGWHPLYDLYALLHTVMRQQLWLAERELRMMKVIKNWAMMNICLVILLLLATLRLWLISIAH